VCLIIPPMDMVSYSQTLLHKRASLTVEKNIKMMYQLGFKSC
jgi:hypothetical protein